MLSVILWWIRCLQLNFRAGVSIYSEILSYCQQGNTQS